MTIRKRATSEDRITPCQFCEYPISQRHHALPASEFGETIFTLQLCANCHELYHIVERVYLSKSARSNKLLNAFTERFGTEDARLKKSYHFIAAAINIARGEIE